MPAFDFVTVWQRTCHSCPLKLSTVQQTAQCCHSKHNTLQSRATLEICHGVTITGFNHICLQRVAQAESIVDYIINLISDTLKCLCTVHVRVLPSPDLINLDQKPH
jgi:hypothetical protein